MIKNNDKYILSNKTFINSPKDYKRKPKNGDDISIPKTLKK